MIINRYTDMTRHDIKAKNKEFGVRGKLTA
jgi:hypothetical protein